jgi:hypothetical protein
MEIRTTLRRATTIEVPRDLGAHRERRGANGVTRSHGNGGFAARARLALFKDRVQKQGGKEDERGNSDRGFRP